MEKMNTLIEYMLDELCESKDTINIDDAMKYADMIKDLADARYHHVVTEAMEESGYELTVEKYKEHNPEYYRDMDKKKGIMYYTDTDMDRPVESKSSVSKRTYMEHKKSHMDDRAVNQHNAEVMIIDTISDVKEAWAMMSPEERSVVKAKLNAFVSSI